MGFVYYGNYATYYEVGRVEALRSLGLTYKSLEEQGIQMPVIENKSRYIRAAKYDDLLTLKVMIRELPVKKICFEYEIMNEDGILIHTGETSLLFINASDKKICSAPGAIVTVLKPHIT
jgi:acyl-CoA thioester hydrolase